MIIEGREGPLLVTAMDRGQRWGCAPGTLGSTMFASRSRRGACGYIQETLVPSNLTFVYPRWNIDAGAPLAYLPGFALVLLLVAAWRYRAGWGRPVLAGLGGFVLSMLPALGLIDVYFWRYSLVGDHYQYQSIAFTIALVVGLLYHLLVRRKIVPSPRAIPVMLAGAAVHVPLFALTWRQSGIYVDEESVWRDTIAKNPASWLAYNNLGNLFFRNERFAEAVPFYVEALRCYPDDAMAHFNLAAASASLGRVDEAVQHWLETVRLDPDFPDARRNLAIAYQRLRRPDDARAVWEEILARDPSNVEARAQRLRLLGAHPTSSPSP